MTKTLVRIRTWRGVKQSHFSRGNPSLSLNRQNIGRGRSVLGTSNHPPLLPWDRSKENPLWVVVGGSSTLSPTPRPSSDSRRTERRGHHFGGGPGVIKVAVHGFSGAGCLWSHLPPGRKGPSLAVAPAPHPQHTHSSFTFTDVCRDTKILS